MAGYDLNQPTPAEMLLEVRKQQIRSHLERLNKPFENPRDAVFYVQAIGELIHWARQFPDLVPLTVEQLQKKLQDRAKE